MRCDKCQIPDDSPAVCIHMAGRRGGTKTRDEQLAKDPDYYRKMGSKGGNRVKELLGRAYYEEIGRKGGTAVKKKHGAEFYERIGRKGGTTVKKTRGVTFYEEIGRQGGSRVRELVALAKQAEMKREEKP